MTLERDKIVDVFFSLLKAGLWEKGAQLSKYGSIDIERVCQLAEEQAVVGLIAAGTEHVVDIKCPKETVLTLAGEALQLEQRNSAMNIFISSLVDKMRESGIKSILVKGQGIAQCYERPLWRCCGDIDLLLDQDNYFKAVRFLTPYASSVDEEDSGRMHYALTIGAWLVELHGTLHSGINSKIDRVIDKVQEDTFLNDHVRIWMNGKTSVQLPCVDNDIIFVFTHILQHFFLEGIGIRQICDWCRLIWTNKEGIDKNLLEMRLKEMGLMTEWKTFAALAVNHLGMPNESMPLYSPSSKWNKNALRLKQIILETGNFGQNWDKSYHKEHGAFVCKLITFHYITAQSFRKAILFPMNSTKVWYKLVKDRLLNIA